MKRVLLWLGAVVVLLGVAVAIWSYRLVIAREDREVGYLAALERYSTDLKPGVTRREVESYLRAKGVAFGQRCCWGADRNALDDFVKIGEEFPPWYCSRREVLIVFDFDGAERRALFAALDGDVLKAVRIQQFLATCL